MISIITNVVIVMIESLDLLFVLVVLICRIDVYMSTINLGNALLY